MKIHFDTSQHCCEVVHFPVTDKLAKSRRVNDRIGKYVGKGEFLLIVDDVPEQREILKSILKRLNYRVVVSSSGKEAVAYLRHYTVDLVILDMIMTPGMDGLDTYKQIRLIRPEQKVVIVSGYSESDKIKEALKLGVKAYLKKPYEIENVARVLQEALL